MKEIRISPTAQVIALAVLGAAIVAAAMAQAPEIQRYLKIRSM
jgi:hypothetical protein